MNEPTVTFWGGVGNVTGANFLVEFAGKKILIDCGILQGVHGSDKINAEDFPYEVESIDYIFVTHAHMDHIGRIPKIIKDGFRGEIFSTDATKNIASIMLSDAARILDRNAREMGVSPMYTEEDARKAFSFWKTISYHQKQNLIPEITVTLYDAGHILGSSTFLFSFNDGKKVMKVLFCCDLGNSPSLLAKNTEFITDANYIVIDSVYGDRNHEPKEDRDRRFVEEIKAAIERKGTVLIPAFSLERTQTILYQLNNLIEERVIPSIPVFLDSPLAIRLTDIYESITSLYNEGVQSEIRGGDDIFSFPKLKQTARVEESKKIERTPDPKIIIAGSGMSTAGRILHHEARFLPDRNATILLMGYQAAGTPGRQIEEGAKKLIIDEKEVEVNARVVKIGGYSAHKDSDGLVEFIEKAAEGPLKQVFVVLGEPKASAFLAQRLRADIGVESIVPEKGKTYVLK